MKHLLLFLTLSLFGFDNIKTMQDSFGFMKAYFAIQYDENYQCKNCMIFPKDMELLEKISEEISRTPYIKASSFVVAKKKDKTLLSTSMHVCESLLEFTQEKRFKLLADKLMEEAVKSDIFLNTEIIKIYRLVPKMSVQEFEGKLHYLTEVKVSDTNNDICLIESEDSWGTPVKFVNTPCYYEKIYNISASGGQYEKGTAALREGICNHIVNEVIVDNKPFKNHHLYTLEVLPGASGSAVFNSKGEVCGNINISYQKVGLSLGATSKIISASYDNFLRTPQGSSYVVSE